jgi:hypothetical protein
MDQPAESPGGSYGRPGVCDPAEIAGRVVFLIPSCRVPVGDEHALAEGFCPECHVRLAGERGNWCPECATYWYRGPGTAALAALQLSASAQ